MRFWWSGDFWNEIFEQYYRSRVKRQILFVFFEDNKQLELKIGMSTRYYGGGEQGGLQN